MSNSGGGDLSAFSMLDLFRAEAETQMGILANGLVQVEGLAEPAELLKELMRAAHSMKGAARIVNYESAVLLSHAMEDCLVAAQTGALKLSSNRIDALLRGVDLISAISMVPEAQLPDWDSQNADAMHQCIAQLTAPEGEKVETPVAQAAAVAAPPVAEVVAPTVTPAAASVAAASLEAKPGTEEIAPAQNADTRALRITAENLNRLLALAGESLLATRWLETFATELLQLKRHQQVLARTLLQLDEDAQKRQITADILPRIKQAKQEAATTEAYLSGRIDEFDIFQGVFTGLSNRLYQVVLDCRMRPFRDVAQGFHRMVRDVAKGLGKEARLEIVGLATPIDRDILDRLEAPLNHIVRNSLDHGLELPEARAAAGKATQGTVKLEARHTAGTLLVEITDDGRGIDVATVRQRIVDRHFASPETANSMSEAELFEFLFLPGFSLKDEVTEISGRGVGLDAVQTMVREVGGDVRISSTAGAGTRFQLLLPLTRSVLRTLVVEIAEELYAFPLAKVHSAAKLDRDQVISAEGRQYFVHQGERVGLVVSHQVLGLDFTPGTNTQYSVVVLEEHGRLYGLMVDRLVEERELVVLPLDKRLGKVQNISAAALLPDRSPILIFDTSDLFRSVENLISGERLHSLSNTSEQKERPRRRILVVDDSLTVRELERKLLVAGGYQVEAAVDGVDGWNAVRTHPYDLVITDVDMPRMDGIELVNLIRKDARFQTLPVVIVSYKDRPEDRQRGLDAGADHYLTKTSFQDETFLRVVADLIGEAVV